MKLIQALTIALLLAFAPSPVLSQSGNEADELLSVVWVRFRNRTCVNIYADGRYRFEKVGGLPSGMPPPEIFEGVISDERMKILFEIISQKDFEALRGELPRAGFFVIKADGQLVQVVVRRANQAQKFTFGDPNGQSSLPTAVMPLLKWIREIKPGKASRIKDAKPVLCPPKGRG